MTRHDTILLEAKRGGIFFIHKWEIIPTAACCIGIMKSWIKSTGSDFEWQELINYEYNNLYQNFSIRYKIGTKPKGFWDNLFRLGLSNINFKKHLMQSLY